MTIANHCFACRSVPPTLIFCSELSELYLDHNLLDALPGFLLKMPNLRLVHRHGNHNYFKATFMWYHTDVNNRIMADPGRHEHQRQSGRERTSNKRDSQWPFQRGSLQEAAALAALGGRINFYEAGSIVPPKMQDSLSSLVKLVNLCGNCAAAKHVSHPGFKVFTFKNPYLGNTCVPFLHWACTRHCAEAIEVPARREQVHY